MLLLLLLLFMIMETCIILLCSSTFFPFQASVPEEAQVTVCVEKMKGVPNSTLLLDDGAVEFPLVSYSYSVSYDFLDEALYQKSVSKLPLQVYF